MKQSNCRTHYKPILLFFIGLLLSVSAFAQQITVRGHVKDTSGDPVIGANVVLQGNTSIGTITNVDGDFILAIPRNSILEISFIGYKSTTVAAAETMTVTLEEDAILLQEAVIIGYGTVRKNDLTGSVTAIRADKETAGFTVSPQEMMTGKIAGVSVISNDGTPGGAATIRIRGGSSLNASNDPLIVIDGLAMDNDGIRGMSNPLALVNPNDIETFTVLKDASATAIYGSRASNGVIIITTKRGKAGSKPQATYNGSVSFATVASKLDVMDGDQYREYVTNIFGGEANLPYALGTANTDWQKEIYRTAVSQDHNVTVTGGYKNIPYRVSLGYTNQDGIVKTSNFERYTAALNLSPSFFDDYLKFNLNAKYMQANNRYADGGAIGSAIAMDPTRPVYDDSTNVFGGYFQWSNDGGDFNDPNWLLTSNNIAPQNPVALLKLRDDRAVSKSFVGNIEADYKLHFFPDVRIHANFGGDYSQGKQTTLVSPYSYSNNYYGWDGVDYQYKYNLSGNMYAQYTKSIDAHHIDVMAGAEQQHFHRTGYNEGQGTHQLTGAANNQQVREQTEYGYHTSLVSYFGRANYSLMDRYLITATVRRDGTSRFSKDNRWSTFPSVALAWKANEESFLRDVDYLSNLKLRLGWGITGQQNISDNDFPYLPQYVSSSSGAYYQFGDELVGTSRPREYNLNLKWEETTTWNAGIDYGFLNGRINGAVDVYYRETKDLINNVKIASGTNFNTMLISNIGKLENKGVEFTIHAKPVINRDFMWEVDYNLSYNKNKITELSGGDDPNYYVATGGVSTGTGSNAQAHKVGYAASSFYVYQQVYDDNGKPIENLYVDRNGDGIINDDDRYIYKKPAGDVLMGLTSKMTYKDFDFSFSLRASINNYVYNDVLAERSNVSTSGMWGTQGFYANKPTDAIGLGFSGIDNYYMSDYFVQNASFLRCDNITLGYSFRKLFRSASYGGINGRVYTSVQNPFVITKYDGVDPEVNGGIDNNIYPRPRTFMLGVSLQF